MHSEGSGEPNQLTILALFITIIFFGSNFVPVKGVEIRNYAFFQWVMCNAILLTALPWCLVQQEQVQLHPVALLGGISWCCGNYLCPLILDRLGLGVGSLLWGTVEMFTAWMSGTFGILGVEKQIINKPWLNFVGVIIVVAGGFVLSQVTSEDNSPSSATSSSFSTLSSSPLKSNQSPDPDHPEDIQAVNNMLEKNHAEEEKSFLFPEVTSSPVGIVYYNNPLLQSGSITSARTNSNIINRAIIMDIPQFTPSSTSSSSSSASPPCVDNMSRNNDLELGHIYSMENISSNLIENPLNRRTASEDIVTPSADSITTPLSASEQLESKIDVTDNIMDTKNPLHSHVENHDTLLDPQPCTSPIVATSTVQFSSSFRPISSLSSVKISPAGNMKKDIDHAWASSNDSLQTSSTCGFGKLGLRPFEEGILLSIVAGLLFGISFNPTQFLVDQSDGKLTAGTLIVSHYVGICYTSYVLYIGSILWNKQSPFDRLFQSSLHEIDRDSVSLSYSIIDVGCIVPAMLAGLMWGVGAIAWFVAAETLPISVTFPLISAGPNIVTMCWSLLYFREVQNRKDQFLLSLALILLGMGLFCVWFSNL